MTDLRGLGRAGRRGWKILLLTGGGTNQEGREGGSPDACFNPVMHSQVPSLFPSLCDHQWAPGIGSSAANTFYWTGSCRIWHQRSEGGHFWVYL